MSLLSSTPTFQYFEKHFDPYLVPIYNFHFNRSISHLAVYKVPSRLYNEITCSLEVGH